MLNYSFVHCQLSRRIGIPYLPTMTGNSMTEPENSHPPFAPLLRTGDAGPESLLGLDGIRDLARFKINSLLEFILLSPSIEFLAGFPATDFLLNPDLFFDITLEPDRETLRSAIRQSIADNSYLSAHFRIRDRSGEVKSLWIRGPARVSPGQDRHLHGIISDITIQKKLENELQAERELFRAFADTLDDGICITSEDCLIQFMNRNMIDMVGDRTGETCYKALFNREGCCTIPDDSRDGQQYDSCGFRAQQLLPGSSRVFQSRSLPIHTESGFKGRVGLLRDITRLKKLERWFREFAVQVRAIAKAADMAELGIFILADTLQMEAQFRFATPAFCRLTGYTSEELPKMSIADVIHPDDLPNSMDRYRRRLGGERMGDTYEIKLLKKNNFSVTVIFMGALVKHYGKTATVGFVRDITPNKKLQDSLLLSQKLASIGKLSAEIAHEINNPLTSVLAFNKLIEKILQQQPFPVKRIPEVQDYVRYVNSEAGRCAEIARNLLNFSRTTEIRITENDLRLVVEKTLDILRHRAEMNNVKIVTDFCTEIPLVHYDFNRMQQAMLNIMLNALDAMPRGGVLAVATSFDPRPQCTYRCKSGKNMIQVTITDTGVGIPKENLDHIFEPFFSTKKEKSGVGLGLSVAYGIVRKHNGQILVRSEPGNGSCFIIQLPTDLCAKCPFTEC